MRTKLMVLVAAILTIILSCAETTSVEAPGEIDPSTNFEVTINTMTTNPEPSLSSYGYLAILIPEMWIVDSVYCVGYGYSGPLDAWWNTPSEYFPPASGYEWSGWRTPVVLHGDSGETGYANAIITTIDSLGTFQLAFCAGTDHVLGPLWEDTPCSCTVEVTPLSLEQETWGHIKSEF